MALQDHREASGPAIGVGTVTKKKSKTTSKTKKQNGKPNGKGNGVERKGAGTIAFTAYPEHIAAVAALAEQKSVTRSEAARMLIEKGKTALRLRVPK